MAWQSDYATVADLRSYATRSPVTADDAEFALAITSASRAVDRATNRQFGIVDTAEERHYTARFDRRRSRWVVDIDDLMTDTGLVVSVAAGTVDTFDLQPANAPQNGGPWLRLVVDPASASKPTGDENEVSVTALWGWTAVPDPIKQGTLLQANRIVARRTSPYGVAGSPDLGSELRLLAKVDPDVAVIIGPYIRWWAAA